MPGVGRRRYGHSHGDVERSNCASSIFYAKAALNGRSLLSPRQSPAGLLAANLFRGQGRSLLSPRRSPAGLLAANLFCGQGRSLLSPRQSPEGLLAANLFCGHGRSLLSPRQSPAGPIAANLFCGQGRSIFFGQKERQPGVWKIEKIQPEIRQIRVRRSGHFTGQDRTFEVRLRILGGIFPLPFVSHSRSR